MVLTRRDFVAGGAAGVSALGGGEAVAARIGSGRLYGLITQFIISPDHRDEFIHLLSRPAADLPGCLSYVIAKDAARQDAVWITEVWADKESHARSLKRPEVLEAIGKGRPLVTGMGVRVETEPVAGV